MARRIAVSFIIDVSAPDGKDGVIDAMMRLSVVESEVGDEATGAAGNVTEGMRIEAKLQMDMRSNQAESAVNTFKGRADELMKIARRAVSWPIYQAVNGELRWSR